METSKRKYEKGWAPTIVPRVAWVSFNSLELYSSREMYVINGATNWMKNFIDTVPIISPQCQGFSNSKSCDWENLSLFMYWDYSYHLFRSTKWLFLTFWCGTGTGLLCTPPNTTTFSTIYGLSRDVSLRRRGGISTDVPAFFVALTFKYIFSGVKAPLNKHMCGSNYGGGPSSCCFVFNSPIVYFLQKIHYLIGDISLLLTSKTIYIAFLGGQMT